MKGNGKLRLTRPGMLSTPERILHHVAVAAVGLSGVGLAWMKYGMEPSDDPFTVVNHPWQPYALDLHVLAAPLWILAVGMILRQHVIGRLRNPLRRRGRRSGAWSMALLLPMVASGYLLQVVTAEGWRGALVWVHVLSGSAYLLVFLAHLVVARRTLRQLREEASRGEGPPGLHAEGLHLRIRAGRPAR